MKRYEISAHIADIRLVVEGTTLPELFNAALDGMASIITSDKCRPPYQEKFEVTVHSMDRTMLLIDFLSDVLTQIHLDKVLYCAAEFQVLTDTHLHAIVYGGKLQNIQEDIKAVTYHQAEVKHNEQGNFETVIIFDI